MRASEQIIIFALGGSSLLAAPAAPVLTWPSDASVNTPTLDIAAPDLVEGDTVRFRRATLPDFSDAVYFSNTVDAAEDLANTLQYTSGPWADGLYYVGAQIQRTGHTDSDWSNTVSKTIAGETLPHYTVLFAA